MSLRDLPLPIRLQKKIRIPWHPVTQGSDESLDYVDEEVRNPRSEIEKEPKRKRARTTRSWLEDWERKRHPGFCIKTSNN